MNEDIQRVNSAISRYVRAFIEQHSGQEFHVEQLRKFIFENVNGYVAPASPDRILRDLRQKGVINYVVVSRSQSLYKSIPVKGQLELF